MTGIPEFNIYLFFIYISNSDSPPHLSGLKLKCLKFLDIKFFFSFSNIHFLKFLEFSKYVHVCNYLRD